jgi:hypothetical protein
LPNHCHFTRVIILFALTSCWQETHCWHQNFAESSWKPPQTMSGNYSKVQVKQFHYRPWEALRVPGDWGTQILIQSAHEGGKGVSPTQRPPLLPRKYSWYSFVRGWVDPRAIVRPEGLCQRKIPVTPSGIYPATSQFKAQCLNCATACPRTIQRDLQIYVNAIFLPLIQLSTFSWMVHYWIKRLCIPSNLLMAHTATPYLVY